ncbi:hypothetical protein SAMD00019534_009960 [Acytostelium subglobosum LB1]|uniref:hypothetical protein n=1 Tax=Acytostelium subglobosum LB1 TaxID=1410327 RepID=UPI000644D613|nr:hypothetical protein SAMD00019534_009960 [Acytostelium subglobosum LB1]GAM17821.1 hypothetical protein SAMD00019534_009960 [Acytostelium subglobosum LB1]|eukprot:XP_012758417.1 hypothetical protein SAMD00019534_009960 [Acytostelium subglobosum LB1]
MDLDRKISKYSVVVGAFATAALVMFTVSLVSPIYTIHFRQESMVNANTHRLVVDDQVFFSYKCYHSHQVNNSRRYSWVDSSYPRMNSILSLSATLLIISIIFLILFGINMVPIKKVGATRFQVLGFILVSITTALTFVSLLLFSGTPNALRYTTQAGGDPTCIQRNRFVHQCASHMGSDKDGDSEYKWGFNLGFWAEVAGFLLLIVIIPLYVKIIRLLSQERQLDIQNVEAANNTEPKEPEHIVVGVSQDIVYGIDEVDEK